MQMAGWIWILIPLAGIAAKMFKEWLKVQAHQRALGASTKDLEADVATLRKENDALNERLKNLEAIVVSQTWDVLHDKALPPADREKRVATVAHREFASEPGPTDAQRAAQLAQRLGG